MKVIKSDEDEVVFDNGLSIVGEGEQDCCAVNYIDFSQFYIGREFPDMSLDELEKNIVLKDDGVILKDASGVPAWGRGRSEQNGYYSDVTYVYVKSGGDERKVGKVSGELGDEW